MNKRKKNLSLINYDLPILSFFTGGGFLDMGFEQAGFQIVWTNEANSVFAEMYNYGMKSWRKSIGSQSINLKISDERNLERIFAPGILKNAFPDGRPEFFGVIGGPPCPDFSTGGKNRGSKGENGRLSKTFVNRICKIKPSFFVFENVAGLYKTKIHRKFLLGLENRLEAYGYYLDLRILNALELGVPQDRERLIMIGILEKYARLCLSRRIKKNERGWFPWPEKPKYTYAKNKFSWPGIVKNGKKPPRPANIPIELTIYNLLNDDKPPSKEINGKDSFKAYSSKFHTVREGDTGRKSFKRLHRYRFSPTACYGHNEVHLHPWEKRRLSVREAMRIQGIPDGYTLPEKTSLTAKFSLVSNGVPVPLAYEVAVSLRKFIKLGNILTTKVK